MQTHFSSTREQTPTTRTIAVCIVVLFYCFFISCRAVSYCSTEKRERSIMNTNHKSKRWTPKQLETILNTEHIRQHLMRVGLINAQGDILSKEEYERQEHRRHRRPRSKRQHSNEKNLDTQTSIRRSSNARPSVQFSKSPEQYRRAKTPDSYSFDRRLASGKASPTRPSRNLSSPNRSTRLNRRTISPKMFLVHDRCLVTMMYYGAPVPNDKKRDAIIVMQQHCGGENIVVFKGALLPNETFQFESRRHPDYPFALAFYINGLIDNRLSICCEWRYRKNVRLGGRRGLFGILQVRNSKACQRCQVERRMNRLALLKQKQPPLATRTSSPELPASRSSSPEDEYPFSPGSPIEVGELLLKPEDQQEPPGFVKTHPSFVDEPNERLSCASLHNDELQAVLIANTQATHVGGERRRSLVSATTGDDILLVSDRSTNDLEEQPSKTDDD